MTHTNERNDTSHATESDGETIRIVWRGIPITLTWTADHCEISGGMISGLQVMADNRAPLPITETGYRSHWPSRASVEERGGPAAYVVAWLDHEAKSSKWQQARQLSLF